MTTEQLSGLDGLELDAAIARAMGCDPVEMMSDSLACGCNLATNPHDARDRESVWPTKHWPENEGYVPAYSSSVDALIEGPEAKAAEAGFFLTVTKFGNETSAQWHPTHQPSPFKFKKFVSADEPAARALAVHDCLTAIAAIEEGFGEVK